MSPTISQEPQAGQKAMHDRHRSFCGVLDRLITIGSYYQPSHERFQATARAAEDALQASVAGFETLEIFVTAEGLLIHEGLLGRDEPEARRLYQLLEPLHVALLEVDAGTSSDHLHLAFSALKKAHSGLGQRVGYSEVEIQGLPETVRAISRSLYLKTRVEKGPPGPAPAVEEVREQVHFFEHNLVGDLQDGDPEKSHKLEREFLGIIQGIMSSVDAEQFRSHEPGDDDPDTWLPPEAARAIKGFLSALSDSGADPMSLENLIDQAQASLRVTGDPQLVELVFSRLQKTGRKLASQRVRPGMVGKGRNPGRARNDRRIIMSLQEMQECVESLDWPEGPIPDPEMTAEGDCLAVCLQVLLQQPLLIWPEASNRRFYGY
jgi:hypothetical protein